MNLVIYTCLFGDKEEIGNPLANLLQSDTDLALDYICFTDNRALTSDVWKFVYLDDFLSGERLSRKPKTMPHLYLQQWEYSLYIDNIVQFKRLPRSQDLITDKKYLFKLFRHTRNSLAEEADAIAGLGYENVDVLVDQLSHYQTLFPIETIAPLSTCTVILREHQHPKVMKFGQAWWEQFLTYSKRDQMSFDFCIKYLGCEVEYFENFKHNSDLIHKTNNIHGRVRASFDSKRYAWIHRQDPEAVKNPKRHFLNSEAEIDIDYNKKSDILAYLCYKNNSSLGSFISPRRNITNVLSEYLRHKTSTDNVLYVFVESLRLASFDIDDFNNSCGSIHQFLYSIGQKGESRTIAALKSKLTEKIVINDSVVRFSKYVFFNIDNQNIEFIDNYLTNLDDRNFMILLLANEEIKLDHVFFLKHKLEASFSVSCHISINSTSHDSVDTHISNSVISIICKK